MGTRRLRTELGASPAQLLIVILVAAAVAAVVVTALGRVV